MPTPQPGVYRKGHAVRVADTAAEAVALAFDGYRLETSEVLADENYQVLQKRARDLGIPANQSKAALAEAIANHAPADGEAELSNERPAPDLSYVSPLGDGTDEADSDS